MSKTLTKPKTKKDPHSTHKHRVYCDPVLWVSFCDAAKALGFSPSALIAKEVKTILRRKAPQLRKLGVKVPELAFAK